MARLSERFPSPRLLYVGACTLLYTPIDCRHRSNTSSTCIELGSLSLAVHSLPRMLAISRSHGTRSPFSVSFAMKSSLPSSPARHQNTQPLTIRRRLVPVPTQSKPPISSTAVALLLRTLTWRRLMVLTMVSTTSCRRSSLLTLPCRLNTLSPFTLLYMFSLCRSLFFPLLIP